MKMMKDTSPQLGIEIGKDFFFGMISSHGVAGWNGWTASMLTKGHLKLAWDERETPPAWFTLDFSDMDCQGWNLDGVSLAAVSTESAIFRAASLQGSAWGWTPNGDFRDADLTGADFHLAEISGCRFEEACVQGMNLDGAVHDPDNPPSGLGDDLLRRCRPLPALGKTSGTALPEITIAARVSLVSVSN